MALALAGAGPPAVQRDLAKEAKRRRWSAEQVQEAAVLAQAATVTTTTPDGCLPGLAELLQTANSNLGELLAVRAAIRRQLGAELQALSAVARERAATLLEARNVAVVDAAAAADARDSSRAQKRLFDQLAGMGGPLADLIGELAAMVTRNRTAGDVVADHLGRVRRAIEQELEV